jgi:N-alpha-acetyltransferase 40
MLMGFLEIVSRKIPNIEKVMVTCFLSNTKALQFYQKLGYKTDEYSPPPKILRNGTKIEADYVILSKEVHQ